MFERVKRKKFISETNRTWTGDLHIYGPTCYQLIHLDSWHVWMLYNFKIYIQLKNWRGKILEFINYIQATNWAFLNYMQTIKFNCIYFLPVDGEKTLIWIRFNAYVSLLCVCQSPSCLPSDPKLSNQFDPLWATSRKTINNFLHRSPCDISLILKH